MSYNFWNGIFFGLCHNKKNREYYNWTVAACDILVKYISYKLMCIIKL